MNREVRFIGANKTTTASKQAISDHQSTGGFVQWRTGFLNEKANY